MADLGQAYVQIVPKATGIQSEISNLVTPGATKAGEQAGSGIGSGIKKAIVAAGIGTAVVGVVKGALEEGGALQQSYGGLETIYGDAAEAAKAYAAEAAKAGISANSYAEQAVSFGASLKQAFEGDTTKAVEAANTAIMDMTDNAAKMGTPIENIQNAYQGFAKQNYTMLDNLKLGYGGTKTEMERLLADAQKLSGQEYDISNLGDVYDAIHVIQGELGLTGVAAQEASETFTGSMGALKASWSNFMGALALGDGVDSALTDLINNAITFLTGNLIPMVKTIAGSLVSAIPTLMDSIWESIFGYRPEGDLGSYLDGIIDFVYGMVPDFINSGMDLLQGLIDGIVINAPAVFDAIGTIAEVIFNAIAENGPGLLQRGGEMVTNLVNGIMAALPGFIQGISTMISQGISFLVENAPAFIEQGVNIIQNLISGIMDNMPGIIDSLSQVLTRAVNFIMQNLPKFLSRGVDIIMNLGRGIVSALPKIMESLVNLLGNMIKTIIKNLPKFLQQGVELVGKLAAGLIKAIPSIASAVLKIPAKIFEIIRSTNWLELGLNIIRGIANGIASAAGQIIEAIKGVIGDALSFAKRLLGIKSPSRVFRDQVGKMVAAGFAQGIEGGERGVLAAVRELSGIAIEGVNVTARQSVASASMDAAQMVGIQKTPDATITARQMAPFAAGIAERLKNEKSTINNWNITIDGSKDPQAVLNQFVNEVELRLGMA